MRVADYEHLGGRHGETASLQNLLAHAGMVAPHTKEPLSEELVFGIAGGIGAGYSFCPSTLDRSSGVLVFGRHLQYTTGAEFSERALERLGVRASILETSAEKKAQRNLEEALEAGHPAQLYVEKGLLPYLRLGDDSSCRLPSHVVVVSGIEHGKSMALVGDVGPRNVRVPLAVLAKARGSVCSYKNRSLTIEAAPKLTAVKLKAAVKAGMEACVHEFDEPHLKTCSLQGFAEWAKMLTNAKNARGWLRNYPGGKLYPALRDAFDCIETQGTGGGLYRGFFADFLVEAADVLGKKSVAKVASRYRDLARHWSDLAAGFLPNSIDAFKQTQILLNRRNHAFAWRGARGVPQVALAANKLLHLETKMLEDFPLSPSEAEALLASQRNRLESILAEEHAALDELRKVV